MERGLYESLITVRLQEQLTRLQDDGVRSSIEAVDDADQPHVIARHLTAVIEQSLREARTPEERLRLAREVLIAVDRAAEEVLAPTRELHAVTDPPTPGVVTRSTLRPATPLSDAALLTNTHGEPNLGSQLLAELATADEADLLCAFVKWHGLRVLEGALRDGRDRSMPFRVITTTYMGATERVALDRLVREFGAEIKVQYDAHRTRLHAKAWMFRRRTGFDTAYVGSSNLSMAALLDGVEWNVRLSQVATAALLQKFRGTFDTYWNDPSYESYDPDRDGDRLDQALREAGGATSDRVTISLSGLEVRPYPYQQQMLEALDVERLVHDRHRNLVVAATGTGKTVIAALDYRRLCDPMTGSRPRLLFVAHRREILVQSLRTYREVLNDASFGELYVGGERPENWRHVFASVQSLHAYGVSKIPADAFDIVVIDEFHHAEARTYRALIDHLAPGEFLGLTATPERADGTDVRSFFDGRTAAELRLWDALGADLLCPFHYFAIADGTDLTSIAWTRGRYDERELGNLYTGNERRLAIVLDQLRDKVADPRRMKALGFCVSVAHAEFMAAAFEAAGISARAVSGATAAGDRAAALADLRKGRVAILFAADLFNEGLDVPDVDTLLMLRPTESSTLFLQQLGRGLRRTPDKAVLTVLDFVGLHRQEFRFDQKLKALSGRSRGTLVNDVERGFPFLPSGCQLVMDKKAQSIIVANLRSQLALRWSQVVSELRLLGDRDLPSFLDDSGLEISDVLRQNHSWTELRREAGLPTRPGSGLEAGLLRRVRTLTHVDDRQRRDAYTALLTDAAQPYAELSPGEQRLAQMLYFTLWPDAAAGAFDQAFDRLRDERGLRDELLAVVDLSFGSASAVAIDLRGPLRDLPLKVHARYRREEVLAGLGYARLDRRPNSFMQGVLYVETIDVDAFFVTLTKSAAEYSPTTMYQDYPISPTLFHWESQSTTSVASRTGQRYISGSSTKLLFVRQEKEDALGPAPYMFAGPISYVQHTGDRPIAFTWKLDHPLPTEFFNASTVAAL